MHASLIINIILVVEIHQILTVRSDRMASKKTTQLFQKVLSAIILVLTCYNKSVLGAMIIVYEY